jgi:hypothetical protein
VSEPEPPQDDPVDGGPPRPRRRARRATTVAPPGSDPAPAEREPERHAEGENDDRLRREKPPHY